jgi:sugar phosphate isomerase/epimerase
MRIDERLDLTCCSTFHRVESWAAISSALSGSLPRIREQLAHEGALAVGLRLTADSAASLDAPEPMSRLCELLRAGDYYVPTMDGVPYASPNGPCFKGQAYLADWRDPARLAYTNRLARLLATMTAAVGRAGACISTVPGAYRAHIESTSDIAVMAAGLLAHAASLKRLREDTGVTVALALEPEPGCHLETAADAVSFMLTWLLAPSALAAASRAACIELTRDDVLRHVGLCLDACHMAVVFEDPAAAFAAAASEGIRVLKVQLSSAVRYLPNDGTRSPASALSRFVEDGDRHQVVVRTPHGLVKFADLRDALRADSGHVMPAGEWRVHFHVPMVLAVESGVDTSQTYLREVLRLVKASETPMCLEVEVYPWDVLPPEHGTTDVCTVIARELDWVRTTLLCGVGV